MLSSADEKSNSAKLSLKLSLQCKAHIAAFRDVILESAGQQQCHHGVAELAKLPLHVGSLAKHAGQTNTIQIFMHMYTYTYIYIYIYIYVHNIHIHLYTYIYMCVHNLQVLIDAPSICGLYLSTAAFPPA